MAIFLGLGYFSLQWTIIRPTVPVISMAWAVLLAWHFTKQFLVLGIMEGSSEFDVFISYSRSKSKWVKEHLYNPLKDFKKPDGSKLKIFFDEDEIGMGEHFTTKYMRSIIDSKLFIPVMSQDYYNKNHCRNEMDIAVKRKVEKLISIFMITFDYKYVPEEFNHINFVDIKKGSDFMPILKNELIKNNNKQIETKDVEPVNQSSQIVDTSNIVELTEGREQTKQELITKEIKNEELGKGIIVINNGAGKLTFSSSGVTLTLNDKNGKKKKKEKKKNSKKNSEKEIIKQLLKKIKKQSDKKSKKKKKKKKKKK